MEKMKKMVSIRGIIAIRRIHTQHKHYNVAGNLTQAHHEEDHSGDGPGGSKSHSTGEGAEDDDGTEKHRLPAKPNGQRQ